MTRIQIFNGCLKSSDEDIKGTHENSAPTDVHNVLTLQIIKKKN